MHIIDIRGNPQDDTEEVGIRFDASDDFLRVSQVSYGMVLIDNGAGSPRSLCDIEDIDDLIKALEKARELWAGAARR
jgi:hypothetical protein